MNPKKTSPPGDANEEIAALIETLQNTEHRLEELTAGEVDTVADRDGRPFLLRRAQEQLRHTEAAKQAAILNALPAHIALLDTQGRIISVNEAWRRFGSPNMLHGPGQRIGLNYLEICDSARGDDASEAHQVAEGIRSVLDGGLKSFSIEYPAHSPLAQRWFLMTVTPLADDHPNGAVVMHFNITERKQMEDQVRQLAFYDTLTELPNRRLLDDRLSQTMAASKRSGCHGALMFLDLDNFKPLNDTHGHEAGDLLLIEAAARLKRCVRETDTVARFGGDEFVLLLSDLNADKTESTSQAGMVAEKIRFTLSAPYLLTIKHEGKADTTVEHHCTASIGVALFINHEASQDDIFNWADTAMYQAKKAGRNLVRFYDAKA